MLSEISFNDIATVGHSFGFGETVHIYRSVVWNGNSNTTNGNGLTYNRIFAQTPFVTGPETAVEFVSPAGRHQTSKPKYRNY